MTIHVASLSLEKNYLQTFYEFCSNIESLYPKEMKEYVRKSNDKLNKGANKDKTRPFLFLGLKDVSFISRMAGFLYH